MENRCRLNGNADEAWLARLRREVNQAQYTFATAPDPVILGLAGPGSGKTRALVYRAAHLVKSGVAPEEILLLTFTNKAAEEMKERLKRLLGFWPQELWAGTFHSIGARILRRHAALTGRSSNFTILDEDDSRSLFKQLVSEFSPGLGEEEKNLLLKRGFLERVLSQARNSGLTIKEVMEEDYYYRIEYLELVQNLAALYEQKKKEINAFDFDDLLLYWLELFEQHPHLRESYRQRFSHVLVDEFQDTNVIQGRIVDLFAGSSSICVVGDDAQSIYAFRFAHVGNILSFPEKYPHCLVVRMEQNYRSTPEIVALANCSISFNREQLHKRLFSKNPPGDKPWIVGARNAVQEASFVSQRIQELHRQGLPLREMAVLYRSSYLATELEFALVRRGIPYRTFGGVKFLQKAHIKDVLAYLKVIYNPADEGAWRRIATLQPGLGPSTFNTLWSKLRQQGDPLEAALQGKVAPSRGKAGWEALCAALQAVRTRAKEVSRAIESIMIESYDAILRKNYPDQYEERLRGIERLAMYSERFPDLDRFLESLVLEESLFESESAAASGDSLTLSTIHSAKGKEWEAVFIIGMNGGHFPSSRAGDQDIPEERRLFYVAVTRARRFLILSTYWEDYHHWGAVTEGPSLFLKELSPECYEPVLLDEYEY
ncbi:MAG TPA: ATP-dependent helicase [Bacillota bacterium]|nr:ATP-dependent helicase [Bacillota bacterium]